MAAMTQFLQKKLLDHTLGIATWTKPTDVLLALHTADPGETGSTAFEVSTSGTGYTRKSILSIMSATLLTSGRSTLTSSVTFGPALTDWGDISHATVHDQLGNALFYGALASIQSVVTGQSFQLTPGQFIIGFD